MLAELTVLPAEDGRALGDVLRRRGYSRRLITRLKHTENGITRRGVTVRTVDPVFAGETVLLFTEPEETLLPVPELKVPILWEDGDAVVFDKPPAMPVHPSMKHRLDTLGNCFAAMYPELAFRPVTRLDRDTSGCVLAAKSQHAASRLQRGFGKEYLAVCCGDAPPSGVIEAPIARERDSLIKRCVREGGRAALTRFEHIAGNGKYTLCRVFPETGRTHQIRVHFAHIGLPLAGDDLYGGSREDIGRQALHCAKLTFISASGEPVTVCSPLPEDMKKLTE